MTLQQLEMQESGFRVTSAEVEILCLLAVHKEMFKTPVDSLTLEAYCAQDMELHVEEEWAQELMKGGFRGNVARAVSVLQSSQLLTVSAQGYAITDRGTSFLTKYAEESGTDLDRLKKISDGRITATVKNSASAAVVQATVSSE